MSGAWRFSFLGQTWGFAQPQAFAWAFLVFAIVFLGIYLALKRKNAVAKMIAARHVDGLTRGVSTTRPLFQSLLYGWGLLCFVIALAQPQCSGKSEWTPRSGIDVVVALDASKSMYAQDVQPSRMQRAKLELTSLLEELKGDRVAIVAFAQEAFVQCPLP